jgi:hypothetical protein
MFPKCIVIFIIKLVYPLKFNSCSRLQDKIIWESNLNLKDAHKLVIKSKFWQDLLVWYSSLNFNDDSNKVTKTDFIWYNSHLKINDKVLYLKCMSENGIKKIEDLIDDNNRFLTYQMFLDQCNVNINAITYYGIISVIKKQSLKLKMSTTQVNPVKILI